MQYHTPMRTREPYYGLEEADEYETLIWKNSIQLMYYSDLFLINVKRR